MHFTITAYNGFTPTTKMAPLSNLETFLNAMHFGLLIHILEKMAQRGSYLSHISPVNTLAKLWPITMILTLTK